MFSLMVQMEVRPGRREEFLAGMAANAEASVRDEPGCLRFDVCVGRRATRTASSSTSSTPTPPRSRRTRRPRTSPQWRTVAEQVVVGQVNTPGELLVTHTTEESA